MPDRDAGPPARPHVLVVDSDPGTRLVVARYVGGAAEVRGAARWAEVQAARAAHRPADLVLTSTLLNDGSGGIDVMDALRQRPAWARVPVIALLPPHALPGSARRHLELGFEGTIRKPLARQRVIRALDAHLELRL